MPFISFFFPVFVPFQLFSRTHKILHFHLFELSHSENKLTRNDFVTESLSDLSNSKRDFHSSCLLNIQEVYKNTLGSFRTQINFRCFTSNRTKLCREH